MNANRYVGLLRGLGLTALALWAAAGMADEIDPPSRVARLAYADGSVSFQPAGTQDWVVAPINRPLTTGDVLWADQGSRAELQLDGSLLRLSSGTEVSLLNLADHVTQVQLSSGTLVINVRRLDDSETYEIDTPNLAFSVLRPGLYRVTVDSTGSTTSIGVRRGQGEVTGGEVAYSVYDNQFDTFSGHDTLSVDPRSYGPDEDDFDAWSTARDRRWDNSPSARYVSPDVIGYEDLDEHGTWRETPAYGYVWVPRGVDAGWAPYHEGHWSYIAPWGYTWVDDRSWGFAPFHYGRWISDGGAWCWVPAPRRQDEEYSRPVYAPALVAWVGTGAAVAWFALGPREVYVPSYPVSRRYVNEVNVSNTTVNTTIVNNVYNTTVINNKTINNVTYVNRNVPGAVMATTPQAFASAQPVARSRVSLDARALASGPVRVFAPATVPLKQAVLGAARPSAVKPPATVLARPVVARVAPPPPVPTFERSQEAIRNNAGKPLSAAQMRQIAPPAAAPAPLVRVAPAARTLIGNAPPHRDPQPAPVSPPKPEAARPTVTHPNDAPPPPRPPSPGTANSVLERQHLQDLQAMQTRQAAERQRLQLQQDQEHQRAQQQAAQQQAAQARREQQQQQLEQQHQQQTQQLLQRHAEEQQQIQQRQEEQRRQQPVQPAPAAPPRPAPPRPTGAHPPEERPR